MQESGENRLLGVAQAAQRQKQQFIADVLTQKPVVMYRPDDYNTIRKTLFDNMITAVNRRFPLYNDKYVLGVQNLSYQDPEEYPADVQKKAVLQGKSLGRRLRGNYVLKDALTDKVVQKGRRVTLLSVPYMTQRGTFIRNGHEYTFNNLMRLEPGVYTKHNSQHQVSAQFNVKKGTGGGFNMKFTPASGIFQMSRGTQNAPAYTVFKDLGVTDDAMRQQWGDQLYQKNMKYGTGQRARQAADKFYNY